jgi:hypothetical protein
MYDGSAKFRPLCPGSIPTVIPANGLDLTGRGCR